MFNSYSNPTPPDPKYGFNGGEDFIGGEKYTYTGNPRLEVNPFSTGSRWQDALLGLGAAYQEINPKNQPANYYVDTNYIGNGLARSNVSANKNYNYRNPQAQSDWLRGALRSNKYRKDTLSTDNPLSNQLLNLFGTKVLGDVSSSDYIKGDTPSSIFDNIWGSGDSIYNYNTPQLSLDNFGNYMDFGKTVGDYLGGSGW